MSARRCLNSAEVCLKPAHLILGLISTLSCLYVLLDANASQGPNLSLRHSVSQSLSDKDGHHVYLYVFISMSLSLFLHFHCTNSAPALARPISAAHASFTSFFCFCPIPVAGPGLRFHPEQQHHLHQEHHSTQ